VPAVRRAVQVRALAREQARYALVRGASYATQVDAQEKAAQW